MIEGLVKALGGRISDEARRAAIAYEIGLRQGEGAAVGDLRETALGDCRGTARISARFRHCS